MRKLRVKYTKQVAYYCVNYSSQNCKLTFHQWTIKFQKCTVQTSCVQHHIMIAETHTLSVNTFLTQVEIKCKN